MRTAEEVIHSLDLAPHPEGGFFREVFRDPKLVPHPVHGRPRAAMTSIYFLLPAGAFSALHRVQQTEIWHHLDGDPPTLHVIENGAHTAIVLDHSEHIVPANAWQAAEPGARWSLCGCTVAPGFDFEDFEMPSRDVLLRELPRLEALVRRLTR
jgi:predicted cupin superfamily sugar epimerase